MSSACKSKIRSFVARSMISWGILAGCEHGATPPSVPETPARRTVGEAVRKLHFREITPPSTLFPPGTLVRLTAGTTADTVSMELVCSASDVLGADPGQVTSSSANEAQAATLSSTFDMDASVLGAIKANARFHDVQDVTLSLSNTQVSAIAIGRLFGARPTAFCIDAANKLDSLYIITSVLGADVEYHVVFDKAVTGGAGATITAELASSLSATKSAHGTNTLSGSRLYWGERGSSDLVSIVREAKPWPTVAPECHEKDHEGYCRLCELTAAGAKITSIAEGQSAMALSCVGMRPNSEVEISASGRVWPSNNGWNRDNQVVWIVAHLVGTAGTVTYSNASHTNRSNMPLSSTTQVPATGRVDVAVAVSHVQTWPNEHGPLNFEDEYRIVVRAK